MKNDIYDLLCKLISFPSISPDSAGCVEFISQYLIAMGMACNIFQYNDTTNLIAEIGNGDVVFAFAGHIDVVPAGNILDWHHQQPFLLQEVDGKLIGRGIADMKGAVAAFIIALQEFLQNNILHNCRILILLTSDEESLALDGTVRIVDALTAAGVHINYCLIGEPTCFSELGDTIKVARRGSLTAKLTIFGKQGHVAYPQLCINPIHHALAELQKLTNYRFQDNPTDSLDIVYDPTNLQLVSISAGSLAVSNVIPADITIVFNIRFNHWHKPETIKDTIENMLHNCIYTLEWQKTSVAFSGYKTNGKLLQAVTDSINTICKLQPILSMTGGTSDGRFLAAISDEIIEFGLINKSIHQINEHAKLTDIAQLSAVYLAILVAITS